MFVTREGCAEVKLCQNPGSAIMRPCQNQGRVTNCHKCFVCTRWFCEHCDLVHTCHICGGTYCWYCRSCQSHQSKPVTPHANAQRCECGSFLDLATPGCEECHRLDCLAGCELRVLTNSCCGKDKCGRCSFWQMKTPTSGIRVCGTCPLPSSAVLK